jgi:hypothetical protein
MIFENTLLGGTFGPTREEVKEDEENAIRRSFIIPDLHNILLW